MLSVFCAGPGVCGVGTGAEPGLVVFSVHDTGFIQNRHGVDSES